MFICGDLPKIPDVTRHEHQLKRKPAPRLLEALAIHDEIKQRKEEKGHSFLKRLTPFYTPFIQHTPTIHTFTHTHHFVRLHIPKKVPLFISALRGPHNWIRWTVFVQSTLI